MTSRHQWLVIAGVVGALAVALIVARLTFNAEASVVDVGTPAPDFRAHVPGTTTQKTLADYKGQVVLLNIWGTFCPPCKVEMPSIERLYKTLGPAGLRVVAVSVDDVGREGGNDTDILAYVRAAGLTFDILHDSTRKIGEDYRTTGWPETFIIDRAGTIRRKRLGAEEWDSPGTRAYLEQLLGVGTAAASTNGTVNDSRDSTVVRSR